MAKEKDVEVKQSIEVVPKVTAKLKNEAIKLYNDIEKAQVSIVEKAIKLGDKLIEIKEIIGHGAFIKYCENDLGLQYKRCQRAMDIASYQERIPVEEVETLSDALQIANTAKKEEKKERDDKELKMFKEYAPKFSDYQYEVDGASNAKEKAEIEKPAEPWADEEDARNIGNRFKSWLKKEEAKLQKEMDESVEEIEDAPLDLDQLIEDAYQQAMLIIGRLDPYEQDNAIDLLIERLQRGDALV